MSSGTAQNTPTMLHITRRCFNALWGAEPIKNNGLLVDPSSLETAVVTSNQRNQHASLLIYLLLLSTPLILFTFRSFDDNRLVSWNWGISSSQALLVFAVLAVALSAALLLSRQKVSEQSGIIILAVVSFLMAIPLWSAPESIIDNGRYFTQAKSLELYGLGYFLQHWGQSIFAWTDLPLIPLLYGLAFKFFGEHRFIIQILTSLFFTATVLLTYLIGTTLWNATHGLIAAILLLGMPYLYSQIPLMMVDIPSMFFLTLAVYASIRAMKNGGTVPIAMASIAIVVAMLSKYSTWLLLTVIPFTVLAQENMDWGKSIKRLSLVAVGCLFLLCIVFVWKQEVIIEQLNILFSYQWAALGRWEESSVSTFFFQIHPVISIAAIASVFLAIKKREKKILIVGWALALLFLLGISRIRYMLVLFPMLALVSAYAISAIPSIAQRKFIAYGIAMSSYVVALVFSMGFLQNTSANNIKLAGEFLNTMNINAVDVLVLPQHHSIVNPLIAIPTLDYHTNKIITCNQCKTAQTSEVKAAVIDSPIRFTWEYAIPTYYTKPVSAVNSPMAVAVIYSDSDQQIPAVIRSDYRLVKQFRTTTKVFKYKTLVDIYLPV